MRISDLTIETLIIPDHEGHQMEMDFKKDFKGLELIKDKIDPFDNKIYQGDYIFYLTDAEDNYLGHLEYEELDKDKIIVASSFSKQKGFYEMLFKLILAKTHFKMIFGGRQQTKRAIESWKKTLVKFKKQVFNFKTRQIEKYNDGMVDDYWTYDEDKALNYVVGLSESDNFINEYITQGEQLLEHRRSCGRIGRTPQDILVRFYHIDPDDAEEMVKMYPNYF